MQINANQYLKNKIIFPLVCVVVLNMWYFIWKPKRLVSISNKTKWNKMWNATYFTIQNELHFLKQLLKYQMCFMQQMFLYLSVIHFTEQINLHLSNQHMSNEPTEDPLCFHVSSMFCFFVFFLMLPHSWCIFTTGSPFNEITTVYVLNLIIEFVGLIQPTNSL